MTAPQRRGFTLIEMLVVISIIGILVSLLLPAIQNVRSAAAKLSCQNRMRQLGMAFHGHEGLKRYLPPAVTNVSTAPVVQHNWATYLLPYVEADHVYQQYNFAANWRDASNRAARATNVPVFLCPSNSTAPRFDTVVNASATTPNAVSDYAPITGVSSLLSVSLGFTTATFPTVNRVGAIGSDVITNVEQIKLADIRDGTSSTILLAEDTDRPNRWRKGNLVAVNVGGAGWADPASGFALDGTDKATATATRGPCVVNCHSGNEIYSFHRNGANFLLCDGSVHGIRADIDPYVLVALVTRRNGDRAGPSTEW